MNHHNQLKGLYLITNDDEFDILTQKIHAALDAAPVALLQYRRKQVDISTQYVEIEKLKSLCDSYQVPLIINDNLEVAAHFQLGVHLGQGDGELVTARQMLGKHVIIGRTCHASLELAQYAAAEGADYLAFGAVYPSSTKPNTQRVSLEILHQAKRQFDLPICAIGGLTVENCQPVIQAGVGLCAVIGDVLNLPVDHIAQRVQAWDRLIFPC
jgi:thiamine-phosphate pyrophosphorylase